jgi:hypothetical protein
VCGQDGVAVRCRRITLPLGAGGLLAAGFLPMAVALADDEGVDVPGTGLGSGMSDLLITPFGHLPLFGTALG